jgi:hypothetical protein
MNHLFIEEPGEQESQQIDRDGGNGGFGGEVLAIEVIDPADLRVGDDQLVGKLGNRRVHGGSIEQGPGKGK